MFGAPAAPGYLMLCTHTVHVHHGYAQATVHRYGPSWDRRDPGPLDELQCLQDRPGARRVRVDGRSAIPLAPMAGNGVGGTHGYQGLCVDSQLAGAWLVRVLLFFSTASSGNQLSFCSGRVTCQTMLPPFLVRVACPISPVRPLR